MKYSKNILETNEEALKKGNWVKLICGASFEDLPSITDLCALYGAAGVHCVDVAADAAVINAARQGLDWVEANHGKRPWLMISINDGLDVHFRKAFFDPNICPTDCHQPCKTICPTEAISDQKGIDPKKCYGCGRCLPVCPFGYITAKNNDFKLEDLASLLDETLPDAIEIHTSPGRQNSFEATIKTIQKAKISLKRISVSCGLVGRATSTEMLANELWLRHGSIRSHGQKPLWQLDGRPMSGDLGLGTSKISFSLWEKIHSIAPPGPLQLAGGTNSKTIAYIAKRIGPQGIAFGGSARKLIQPFLKEAEAQKISLREWPEGWDTALKKAKSLIEPWLSRCS